METVAKKSVESVHHQGTKTPRKKRVSVSLFLGVLVAWWFIS
jgi:hypothetical protein